MDGWKCPKQMLDERAAAQEGSLSARRNDVGGFVREFFVRHRGINYPSACTFSQLWAVTCTALNQLGCPSFWVQGSNLVPGSRFSARADWMNKKKYTFGGFKKCSAVKVGFTRQRKSLLFSVASWPCASTWSLQVNGLEMVFRFYGH